MTLCLLFWSHNSAAAWLLWNYNSQHVLPQFLSVANNWGELQPPAVPRQPYKCMGGGAALLSVRFAIWWHNASPLLRGQNLENGEHPRNPPLERGIQKCCRPLPLRRLEIVLVWDTSRLYGGGGLYIERKRYTGGSSHNWWGCTIPAPSSTLCPAL